jgi:hypothetical protein
MKDGVVRKDVNMYIANIDDLRQVLKQICVQSLFKHHHERRLAGAGLQPWGCHS